MKLKISTSHLVTFLILLIVAAFLIKFLKKEEQTFYVGAKGEARINNYYASELFLEKYNIKVKSLKTVTSDFNFPADIHTALLITDKNTYKNILFTKKLIDWVESGGLVISTAPSVIGKDKKIQLFPTKDIYLTRSASTTDESKKYSFNNKNYELDLYHFSIIETKIKPLWSVQDKHGMHMAAFRINKGTVILANDLLLFNNYNIGKNDHARLLYDLSNMYDIKQLLHIRRSYDASLFNLISQHYLSFIIFISVIVMIILHSWGYFGPARSYSENDNRHFLDHLQYSGRFFWRKKSFNRLYDSVLQETISKIESNIPNWTAKNNEDRINSVSTLTGLEHKLVSNILNSPRTRNKEDFFIFAKHAALIRSKLR